MSRSELSIMDWKDKCEPVDLGKFIPALATNTVPPTQKFNLLLLFGSEGTYKKFIRQYLMERYGFVQISFTDMLCRILYYPKHPYHKYYMKYIRNGCPPPPEYIFDKIVDAMKASKATNFLIDDLTVSISYSDTLAKRIEPFVRLPLVLHFAASMPNCLGRLLGVGCKYTGVITKPRMRRLLEEYHENEEIVMDYYSRAGILRSFNCDIQQELVRRNVTWVMEGAIAKGNFGSDLRNHLVHEHQVKTIQK